MATILERATRLVKRMFSLYYMYVYLYFFYFDFDGKTVFLIHQLLVNDYLLLYIMYGFILHSQYIRV